MKTDIFTEIPTSTLNLPHCAENDSPTIQSVAADSGALQMHEVEDTLVVSGDVDLYEAVKFRTAAENYIASAASPRFDMSEVAFLDSAGLATLLYLSRKAASFGKRLTIRITGGPRRVLRITGIDRMLTVED